MIKTRIRFSGFKAKFILQTRVGIWPFRWWSTVGKSTNSYSDDCVTRYFDTYEEAFNFSVKLSVDVKIKHKANKYEPIL